VAKQRKDRVGIRYEVNMYSVRRVEERSVDR
jgi:hypothetical protein